MNGYVVLSEALMRQELKREIRGYVQEAKQIIAEAEEEKKKKSMSYAKKGAVAGAVAGIALSANAARKLKNELSSDEFKKELRDVYRSFRKDGGLSQGASRFGTASTAAVAKAGSWVELAIKALFITAASIAVGVGIGKAAEWLKSKLKKKGVSDSKAEQLASKFRGKAKKANAKSKDKK